MMEKMVAFCGIVCTECPAFLATQKDDNDERKRVAEMWSKQFQAELKPEEIDCNGCLIKDGELFGHCKVCEIRKCGLDKDVKNCAHCEEYLCEKLNKFLGMVPDAKAVLEGIKQSL